MADNGFNFDCKHEETELRCKTDVIGRKSYVMQCIQCGRNASQWIAKNQIPVPLDTIPAYDEILQEAYEEWHSKEFSRKRSTEWTVELEDKRRKHNEYLQTPEWHKKREKVLRRANYVCEGCGEARAIEVHHKTYVRWGRELLFDLVAVCRRCHDLIHEVGSEDGPQDVF